MTHPVDVHVGRRIRQRRLDLGLTQEGIGESVGVTFQQLQKYERATNRVSASRLFEIAQALDVPVAWFFEGLDEAAGDPGPDVIGAFAETAGARDLAAAWVEIPQAQRLRLRDLAVAMAQP